MTGCADCAGTGFEIVARDGREFARACACRRPAGPVGDFVTAARVPRRYAHCSFATFDPGKPALLKALEKCLRYASGYPYTGPNDEGLGLLFTGQSGVGKTHLAVAVLHELVTQKGARGQFWDFHSLIREIKNSYNPVTATTELQVLEPVVEADVLLLDDLGAWKMTDWMVDTLFYILNSRYMGRRTTLITTNFQDKAPDEAARDNSPRRREYLVERVGTPLRSRLMEMSLLVDVEGDDYRQTHRAGNETVLGGPRAPSR